MGDILKAVCQCGYESDALLTGVGFSFPETRHVYTVAFCRQCQNVQSVYEEDEPPKCEGCGQQVIYYEADACQLSPRYENDESAEERSWYCPSCKTNNLHFKWAGLWD